MRTNLILEGEEIDEKGESFDLWEKINNYENFDFMTIFNCQYLNMY